MSRAWQFVLLLLASSLLLACSSGESSETDPATAEPAFVYDGPGEVRRVQSTTQMHLEGVAIGVGNIWEEDYEEPPGTRRHGLTAAVSINVEDGDSEDRVERVHPGQELSLPGYRLVIIDIDEDTVTMAVIEE